MRGQTRDTRSPGHRPDSTDKALVLLVIGACALFALCVLLLVEVAHVSSPVLEVKTYQPRGAGPSSTVALMIIIAALIGLWGPFSCLRCYDPYIRRCLLGVFALLELWLLFVVCKYCVLSDALSVALWYLYYVPMLLIPLLCLFAALHAAERDASAAARRIKRAAAAATAVLIALVLTNSLHRLVFVFDTANPEWSSSYTYGALYYVVFGMIALEMVLFLGVLFLSSCRRLHSALVPLLALGAIVLAFCVAYALRLPAAFARNFSLSSILFTIATLELCLYSGLLPSFLHYREMFRSLPFDLKVFPLHPARRDQPVLATAGAKALTEEARECLCSYEGAAPVSVHYDKDPDRVYKLQRIAGGILLLTEDVSSLNARRSQLLEKQEALTRTCALLEQERLVALQLRQKREEAALLDEVERSITESLSKASSLIAEAARLQGEDPELARRKLMLAKMLVSYSKRKGELAISRAEDSRYDRERLQLIVGELVADLQACGVDCAALVETTSMLPSETVSVLYDCLYDFAIVTLYHPGSALMVCLRSLSGSGLELLLSLETGQGDDLLGSEEAEELRALLDAHGADYTLGGEDGTLRLRMAAQGGGAG